MQSLSQPSHIKLLALGMMRLLAVDAAPILQEYSNILQHVINVVIDLQIKNNGEEYGVLVERRGQKARGKKMGTVNQASEENRSPWPSTS